MDITLIKDISLVLAGAFVTFLFTLLVLKIQNKTPKITWRKLSNLHIPANNLTGVNWIIENQGNKSAKKIRILVKLSDGSSFKTLDCISSESALEFTKDVNDECNEAIIIIPIFPHNLSLDISALISDCNDEIEISIIGEDLLGKEHESSEPNKVLIKRFKSIMNFMLLIYFIGIIATFVFIVVLFDARLKFEQTKSIANLYLKSNEADEALNIYKAFNENTLLMKDSPAFMLETIKIYTATDKKDKVISTMNEILRNARKEDVSKYLHFLQTDTALDKYRKDSEFINAINEYKKLTKASS